MPHALLLMRVHLPNGYHGDWRSALMEAHEVAQRLGVSVELSYANQKRWIITPNTAGEEMVAWASERFTVGL